MGLLLPDAWTWDFWVADDGDRYHLFFLQAPNTLAHPDLRHHAASVGHAVSEDLHGWEVVADALLPGDAVPAPVGVALPSGVGVLPGAVSSPVAPSCTRPAPNRRLLRSHAALTGGVSTWP